MHALADVVRVYARLRVVVDADLGAQWALSGGEDELVGAFWRTTTGLRHVTMGALPAVLTAAGDGDRRPGLTTAETRNRVGTHFVFRQRMAAPLAPALLDAATAGVSVSAPLLPTTDNPAARIDHMVASRAVMERCWVLMADPGPPRRLRAGACMRPDRYAPISAHPPVIASPAAAAGTDDDDDGDKPFAAALAAGALASLDFTGVLLASECRPFLAQLSKNVATTNVVQLVFHDIRDFGQSFDDDDAAAIAATAASLRILRFIDCAGLDIARVVAVAGALPRLEVLQIQ